MQQNQEVQKIVIIEVVLTWTLQTYVIQSAAPLVQSRPVYVRLFQSAVEW